MMVNCFACGKDIGVSTERRSFSGKDHQRVKYVYFMLGDPWYKRSCLLVVIVLRASTIYSNHTPTKCADHALRATKELMNGLQLLRSQERESSSHNCGQSFYSCNGKTLYRNCNCYALFNAYFLDTCGLSF